MQPHATGESTEFSLLSQETFCMLHMTKDNFLCFCEATINVLRSIDATVQSFVFIGVFF